MMIPRAGIKGAIFDVDGTLLDSTNAWVGVGIQYLKDHGIKEEDIEPNLDDLLDTMSLEEGAAHLQNTYGLTESIEEIRAGFLDIVADFYHNKAELKPGMAQLLKNLDETGVRMVLCTTSGEELVLSALERCGVLDYFEGIVTTEGTNTSKHEPYMYLVAAESIECKPIATLVFEDMLFAIRTANGAGFRTVGVYDERSKDSWETIKKEANFCLEEDFFKNFVTE